MKRIHVILLCLVLLPMSLFAGEWKFAAGLSYISGFQDIGDIYEDNLDGDVDFLVPVGLSFHPFLQMDNGTRFGFDVGPVAAIFGDADFYNLPLGVNYGYTFAIQSDTSAYATAGLKYNIAGGTYVEGSSLGYTVSGGIEFGRNSAVGWIIEFTYDSSEVSIEKEGAYYWNGYRGIWSDEEEEDVKPGEFTLSVLAVF